MEIKDWKRRIPLPSLVGSPLSHSIRLFKFFSSLPMRFCGSSNGICTPSLAFRTKASFPLPCSIRKRSYFSSSHPLPNPPPSPLPLLFLLPILPFFLPHHLPLLSSTVPHGDRAAPRNSQRNDIYGRQPLSRIRAASGFLQRQETVRGKDVRMLR